MNEDDRLYIHGVTEEGKKLRPSDWIERISSVLGSFGSDHRLQYSSAVQPCIIAGEKCLVVARNLEQLNPDAFAFVMGFAKMNRLKVMDDRRQGDRALAVTL